MKRWVRLLPVFLLFVAATMAAQTWTPVEDLELRKEPSLKKAVFGKVLEPGARLEEIGKKGEWIQIKAPNGAKGWVPVKNVKAFEQKKVPAPEEEPDYFYSTDEDENEMEP